MEVRDLERHMTELARLLTRFKREKWRTDRVSKNRRSAAYGANTWLVGFQAISRTWDRGVVGPIREGIDARAVLIEVHHLDLQVLSLHLPVIAKRSKASEPT